MIEEISRPEERLTDELVEVSLNFRAMNTRIDHLDWKDLSDLRNTRDALAGEIRASALLSVFDARDQFAAGRLNAPHDAQEEDMR